MAPPNKLRCCITERFSSCDGIIGDVGEEAAKNVQSIEKKSKYCKYMENGKPPKFIEIIGKKYIQNANVRPFVGDRVFVRGAVIVFGSPIRYDGR